MRTSKQIITAGRIAAALLGLATVSFVGGCQSSTAEPTERELANDNRLYGDVIPPDTEERAVVQAGLAQSAEGARKDGMLHACHFDGGALNSLGEAKLSLMLQAEEACTPLVVYLDVPAKDATVDGRKDAVTMYLKNHGLQDSQIKLELGSNPNSTSPAAQGLATYDRTDSSPAGGSPAPAVQAH